MLLDLHAHYPMHVVDDVTPRTTLDLMGKVSGRRGLGNKARALLLNVLSHLFSDRDLWSGPRITVPGIRQGGVGVVLSVLYRPFEEMDLDEPYAAPPRPDYFAKLVEDLEAVEADVAHHDRSVIRVVHDAEELDQAIKDNATALVHCIEGGFHLGANAGEIAKNVATLRGRGVAYVTAAHLFYRQIATNAPALPFLSDRVYNTVFPQPSKTGLTELGVAAVRAMVANRMIVDISHMRPESVEATFRLLDEIDPQGEVPVISSHAGYRFGDQKYMHDTAAVLEIKRRDGVIGLIMAQHQLNDGIRKKDTKQLAESLDVIYRHIDKIAEITGSHRHVAIGTDFDGFIKPTMGGLEDMSDLKELERALRTRYPQDADLILSENALRVLRKTWSP